jgi:toxin YoeB
VSWCILYSTQAKRDAKNLASSGLKDKALLLLEMIGNNPYQNPPPYEKLSGNLDGAYSRRINKQHRLVYRVEEEHHEIWVIRMWTHYE